MKIAVSKSLAVAACAAALCWVFPGPAAAADKDVIKAGDQIEIHYTCRLKNGEIVATTEQSVADDASLIKSEIFNPQAKRGGIEIAAGGLSGETPDAGPRNYTDFEAQVLNELLRAVIGRSPGSYQDIETRMRPVSGEHDLRMALVRHRSKEMKIPLGEYKDHFGADPQIGQAYVRDPAIPGKIVSVTDSDVIVKSEAQPGTVVVTPIGKGTIRDAGDHWDIEIDAQVGRLLRTGPLVGRVSKIMSNDFIIDFAAPFKDEPLRCDFSVHRVQSGTEADRKKISNKGATK